MDSEGDIYGSCPGVVSWNAPTHAEEKKKETKKKLRVAVNLTKNLTERLQHTTTAPSAVFRWNQDFHLHQQSWNQSSPMRKTVSSA